VAKTAKRDVVRTATVRKPSAGAGFARIRAFPEICTARVFLAAVWGAAELIAEGDYVVGRWEGGGTHTGPAFSDFLIGSLPAASGRKMRFTGTTVLRVKSGKIAEEIGLDDGVTALQQLGLLKGRLTRMSRAGDRPRPEFQR